MERASLSNWRIWQYTEQKVLFWLYRLISVPPNNWTSGHTKSHQQSKTKHTVICNTEGWAVKKKSPTENYVFWPFHQGSYFEAPEQSLLWVHKEVWQQDWYCDTITMIDATYKTTKYDLALFWCASKPTMASNSWVHFTKWMCYYNSRGIGSSKNMEPPMAARIFHDCVITVRQRSLPLKHHSQALLDTFMTFTGNRLGKVGQGSYYLFWCGCSPWSSSSMCMGSINNSRRDCNFMATWRNPIFGNRTKYNSG